MNRDATDIPPEAMALAQQGELLGAIKVTRQKTGMGLKEAKDAVEAYLARPARQAPTLSPHAASRATDLPLQALLHLEQGHLIAAIKATRAGLGVELKSAKEAVENHLERNPELQSRYRSAATARRRDRVRSLVTTVALLAGLVLIVLRLVQQR